MLDAPPTMHVPILRCADCAAGDPGPRDLCPACHSSLLKREEVPGAGTLFATTFIRRPPTKFKADGAYQIAVVDLDAGVRIVGRLHKTSEPPQPGSRVRVVDRVNGYAIFAGAER